MSGAGDTPHRSAEAQSTRTLQAALYAALSVQEADLATRWKIQSRKLLLLEAQRGDDHAGAPADFDVAHDLVHALLAAFAIDGGESETTIVAGFQFGVEAFARGASLHHTVRVVDLLVAMVMHAAEKAAAGNDIPGGSFADGICLARRLQSRAGLLSLAVIRGYTQAHGDTLRDQFRHLRHDLRNPLGTIKSVLALMDDESVPIEARASENFRTMAKRNARSLEEMIADRLGDATVPLPATIDHDISVQAIAQSVRRELRNETERRGVTVLIEATELWGRFDAPGLELLLQATLQAALQESRTGEQIRLTFDGTGEGRVAICLSRGSIHTPIERRDAHDRLTALARRIGASATFADPVVISVPMRVGDHGTGTVTENSVLGETIGLRVSETSHNLRRSREDDHGQANVL